MAVDHGGIDISFTTSAAVAQYYFVKGDYSTGNTITVTSAATQPALGISQEAATASGDVIAVRVIGTSKLKISGTIGCGEAIISHTDGTGITATEGSAELAQAIAVQSGVTGDIIEVILRSTGENN